MKALVVAGCMLLTAMPAAAQTVKTTAATLLDRIQIQDLITDYYADLGGGGAEAFARYYTDDAVLDINNKIFRGRAEIPKAYASNRGPSPIPRGTFHMLLSNPRIEVQGDRATARFIWTGIMNDAIKAPPRFIEQGREYDLLVKRGGEWKIAKRVIIADSGLPDQWDATYTPRKDYDITKDR